MEEKILSILNELIEGQERLTKGLERLTKGQETLTKGLERLTKGQETLTKGQEELRADVTQIKMTLENETNIQIRALYDARDVQNDVNNRIFQSLDRLEKNVERLQLETAHVRIVK